MSLLALCEAVQNYPSSIAIRESLYMYPVVESVHVLSLCLFLGLVTMMDLRLAGLGNRGTPIRQIQQQLFPWQMVGMALIVASGLLLVYAEPLRFYGNIFFRVKLVLLAVAGLNAMAFHFLTYPSAAEWDTAARPPARVRMAGLVSLVAFTGIVVAGRFIAYNWFK